MDNTPQRVFGEIAELYDRARPEYPQQVAADIIEWAGISNEARLLEIGCGTGKATRLFAPLGHHLTCLDPAAGMLDVARRSCGSYPNVSFVEARFEDWELPQELFDIAYSAQAFHWIDPEIGPRRVFESLQPGGTFALFWHHQERRDSELGKQIDAAYDEFAPDLRSPAPGVHSTHRWWDVVADSELFTDLEKREYPWMAEYDADTWIELLQTHSDHRALPDDRRQQLLAAVHDAIERNGGVHRFRTVTEMILARKPG